MIDGESEESIDSVSDGEDENFSDGEVSVSNNLDYSERPISQYYDEEELFGYKGLKLKPKLEGSNGILKSGLSNENLTVEVPGSSVRRFTDGELDYKRCGQNQKNSTPIGGGHLLKKVHLRNANNSSYNDLAELGTPSAPPMIEVDVSHKRDSEGLAINAHTPYGSWLSRDSVDCDVRSVSSHEWKTKTINEQTQTGSWPTRESVDNDGRSVSSNEQKNKTLGVSEISERLDKVFEDKGNQATHLSYYNSSNCNSQYAWQTLVTYDACIRLCAYKHGLKAALLHQSSYEMSAWLFEVPLDCMSSCCNLKE